MAEPPERIKELSFGSWEGLNVEGTPPSARYGHVSAVVGSRMYMYGGARSGESSEYYGDMFILHLGETLRWESVDQHGDKPSGREGPTMNAIGEDLYMFGGADQEGVYTCAEGLYIFNTGSHTWTKRETSGTPPSAQSLTAVVYDTRIFTFGGVLNGEAQNSVHILDTDTMEWTLAQTTGTPPAPRCDHTSVVVGRRMYVMAGSGGNDLWYNDVHTLNLDTLEWAEVKMGGTPPTPRDYTTLTNLANRYLIMFAGFSGSSQQSLSDVHFVDLTAKSLSWSAVAMETSTSSLSRFAHSTVLFNNKLYVFAGQNEEQELNDVWAVEAEVPMSGFKPTTVPRARYSLSTPVPAPRKTITPAQPKEVQPADFQELRSTYLKRINEMFDTLAEKFHKLDVATATLAAERAAFEEEKTAHAELYETQQQELKEMFDSHQHQNEEWVERIREENDAMRKELTEQKAQLEKESVELTADKETFQQKSKKLDAIMKQVQGLSTD